MSGSKSPTAARAIVDEVLGRGMTREIWTGNYEKALPVTVQDFELGAVLPAVFYMFRFGCRRGKGRFQETFGGDAADPPGAPSCGNNRANRGATVRGRRRSPASMARSSEPILGDLLLCFCLENRNRALGRREQVQRVAPAHYMASWMDLPQKVADLRFVPEMIVSMLADQKGDFLEQSREGERTWFAVGQGFDNNVLLKAFNQGMSREGTAWGDRTSDRFQEEADVGLDQLLMIRLAQELGQPPDKLRGGRRTAATASRTSDPSRSSPRAVSPRTFASSPGPTRTWFLVSPLSSCLSRVWRWG